MKIDSPAVLIILVVICTTVVRAQEKLTPALWKRIEAESPKPLPQSPVVKRETSDAHEDGLKGKVKRVIEEHRSYSDVCTRIGRHLSYIDDYDPSGHQLRNVSFANCGDLVGITVYGYIDGFRASLYKSILGSSGLQFTVVGAPPPKPNPPTQKPDKRYTYKYKYSYIDGKLTEMRMFYNDGSRGMYYKYSSSPMERSTSAFTYDDEHNWRTVYKLDEKGNEIEHVNIDVRKVYGHDLAYRIRNQAYDQAGNWTHRTTYELKTENGKTSEMMVSEEFRSITYH